VRSIVDRPRWVAASCVALAALLAGCGASPGGSGDDNAKKADEARESSKVVDVSKAGDVTLTVWDQEVRGGQAKQIKQLNDAFQAKYPNVKIKRVAKSFDDLNTTLKLAVSGNKNVPDVVQANQGRQVMGQLVQGGLLRPLDAYADNYKWSDRYSPTLLDLNRFSDDGKQFGEGSLYGLSQMGEIVGVYYNKQILSELGLTVPTTFGEFEQDLEAAKQAGQIPIQFANNDAFPGIHEFATIQDQIAPTSYLTDLIFGTQRDQLSFDTPENTQAATTLQDWANKGYFTPGFGGAGYDDSVSNFANGEGLFMITGNWIVANLGADNTNFGFFPLPPADPGDPPVATGGAGFPLAIAAGSEQPDAAAAYIDWMTSDHASDLLLPTGEIPLHNGKTPTVQPGTVLADVVDAARTVSDANGVVPYEDWATPTFYDTLTSSIQELMVNRLTPDQFVQNVEADYKDFQTSRP